MSSFGYLKNLPVDIIKIDGSFIRDLDTDPMSRTIVSAITQIGHQRGLKVVAEWVSAQPYVDGAVPLGVDYGQGFALHRPGTRAVPAHRARNGDARWGTDHRTLSVATRRNPQVPEEYP